MPKYPTLPTVHGRFGTIPLIGSDSAGTSFDPDAQDFFTRASITDSTQKNAVNQLVLDLKAGSVWTQWESIYPFVGGSASPHSYNLKSSSYQITWSGTFTHSSSGVKGNGTTGYGDTGLIPVNTPLSQNSAAFACYINSADTTGGAIMGSPRTAGDVDNFQFFTNLSGTSYYFSAFGTTTGRIIGAHSGAVSGQFTASRNAADSIVLYRNGSSVLSGSGLSEGPPPATYTVLLFARNNLGTASDFSDCRMAFAGIATGFSAAQAATIDTAIQTFQTALGRS